MPGKVKVKVVAGKNLPVMDRSNDTTDAYVEVKLGNVTFKTDVCRKSLNPIWNSEWFRFEMDDLELQDEPLQIRLMDHDTYSANDSIGKVYIDLNPLLTNPSKTKEPSGRSMSGWIPVYDTMHGIRGEVNLMVKVELFSDLNKFRQSSCGVKFFFSPNIPEGHIAIQLHGFVEELVVNDDPEYQWIDKIRTPRASNEARQTLFSKLSGEVQRRVGLKALELGGNAVIGYRQCFDLEGESGIVVRGIGTATTLTKCYDTQLSPNAERAEFLSAEAAPLNPLQPNLLSNKPSHSHSKSFSLTTQPLNRVSRMTTSSMPETILRSLCTDTQAEPTLAEVIISLSSPTSHSSVLPVCHEAETLLGVGPDDQLFPPMPSSSRVHELLTPQTSYEGSRRGSMFESDDDRKTDTDASAPPVPDTKQHYAKVMRELRGQISVDDAFATDEGKLHLYRRHRKSKKKDKYSTTALMKRANSRSNTFSEKSLSMSSTEKMKDEVVKFFTRRWRTSTTESVSQGKGESQTKGPYREPRIRRELFTFGRLKRFARRRRSSSLRRSTSESFSIGRQSLESLPSIRSEDIRFEHEWSGTMNYPALKLPPPVPKISDPVTVLSMGSPRPSLSSSDVLESPTKHNASALVKQTASIMQAVKGLSYEPSDKPLRLYISSIDALLVCNSSTNPSTALTKVASTSCLFPCSDTNVHDESVGLEDDQLRSMKLGSATQFDTTGTAEASNFGTSTAIVRSTDPTVVLVSRELSNTNTTTNEPREFCMSLLSTSANNTENDPHFISSPSNTNVNSGTLGLMGTGFNPLVGHGDASSVSTLSSAASVAVLAPHSTIACSEPIPEEQSASSAENSISDACTAAVDPAVSMAYNQVAANGTKLVSLATTTDSSKVAIPVKSNSTATALVSLVSHSIETGSTNALTASGLHTPSKPTSSKSGGPTPVKIIPSPNPNPVGIGAMGRRSSESDLSTPPKGLLNSSIQAMLQSTHGKGPSFAPSRRPAAGADHFDMLEYPFITISQLPAKFIQRIGGCVSARSVKLLERISNLDEPESRDSWWTELRMEIRSHARSICCNVILGYEEHTTICDDVCVLSAYGTAAIVNSAVLGDISEGPSAAKFPTPGSESKNGRGPENVQPQQTSSGRAGSLTGTNLRLNTDEEKDCGLCHVPYSENGIPFPIKMARCAVCKKGRVPDLLLSTVDIPSNIPICGNTCIIQAQVFRLKKDCKGESSAREVSDSLPFLEYELHRRLINKLKVKGMNAIFCLDVQICLGENLMMAIATGTALCLAGLPTPELPKITAGNLKTDTQKVSQYQKVVQEAFDKNREYYKLTLHGAGQQGNGGSSSSDEEDDGLPEVDLATGNKDTYVLEVDDSEDIEIITDLIEAGLTTGFEMSTLDNLIGYDEYTVVKQQMFSHIWRCRTPGLTLRQLAATFEAILRCISFKLRAMKPCVINKVHFRLELPDEDEMQLSITGTALGLREKVKISTQEILNTSDHKVSPIRSRGAGEEPETIFNLECEENPNSVELGSGGGSNHHTPNTSFSIPVTSPSSPSMGRSVESTSPLNQAGTTPPSFSRNSASRSSGSGTYAAAAASGTPAIGFGSATSSHSRIPAFHSQSLSSSPMPSVPRLSLSPHHPPSGMLVVPPQMISYPVCSIPLLQRSRSMSTQSFGGGNKARTLVELTTLSHIPGQKIEKYLGNLNFFFIRETTSIKEMGGPTGFVHNFVMEVTAILRGHVTALGGNALVSYFMTELSLLYNPHKNQGQCLISVGGDAVLSLPPKPITTPGTDES